MKTQQLFILVSFVKKTKQNSPAGIAGLFWDAGGTEPGQTVRKLLWICTSCQRTADSGIGQMVSADSRAHAVLTLTHNALFQVDQRGNKRHRRLWFHVNIGPFNKIQSNAHMHLNKIMHFVCLI